MKSTKKALCAMALSAMVVLAPNVQTQAAEGIEVADKSVNAIGLEIPNPIVTHPSFEAMAESLHFVPLYLTKSSGYELIRQESIDNMAQLTYQGIKKQQSEVTIRTVQDAHVGAEALSGLHGMDWDVKGIDGTLISFAKNKEYKAAYWSYNGWSFAVTATNMSEKSFKAMIIDNLYDMSIHSFPNFKLR